MEVEFITLGDAARRLDVPAPTLRGWADRLEELGIHHLERNHRDERIFYENDMKIFSFIKEQKDRYGRKATTTDLAYVVYESDEFECRSKGEVPNPPKVQTKLSEIDYQYILSHPEFQNFINHVIKQATSNLSEGLTEEITTKMKKELANKLKEIEDRRITKLDELLTEQRKTRKMMEEYWSLPAYKRLFSKNPFK